MKITTRVGKTSIKTPFLRSDLILIILRLICLTLLFTPNAFPVRPPPDGGYAGGNTAEGHDALLSLTSGTFNTAVGFLSLTNDTAGQFNTAVGAGALFANVGDPSLGQGVENTATGAAALLSNTTGFANTAIGVDALLSNTTAGANTAVGARALFGNTIGTENTAVGARALFSNTIGTENTASGFNALMSNTTGNSNTGIGLNALMSNTAGTNNTANGVSALSSNTSGGGNVAVGTGALFNNDIGNTNTALGDSALANNIGTDNTALGADAGFFAMTGRGNVYIGAGMTGVADESQHTYIRNINTTPVSGAGTDTVTVDLTTGLLGHASSSRRYKEDIKPMDNVSEALYRLHPVMFRYNKEIDRTQSLAFGLIAEEVAEVNPDLVARNSQGETESVHYEMVNAMLLNEFLKEHCTVQELKSTLAKQDATILQQKKDFQEIVSQQQKQIEALTTGLQKVSARLGASKPAPQVVTNP